MHFGNYLAENAKVVEAIKPQTGASARSGDWISLKNWHHLTIIIQIAMGNAATTAITVDKATDVSGTGNSDGITIANAYKIAVGAAASDTPAKLSSGASITSSATGSGSEIFVIELDAAELGDGYDCVQVELGSSNAANLVSALYVLSGPRYAGVAANMPSAIVD